MAHLKSEGLQIVRNNLESALLSICVHWRCSWWQYFAEVGCNYYSKDWHRVDNHGTFHNFGGRWTDIPLRYNNHDFRLSRIQSEVLTKGPQVEPLQKEVSARHSLKSPPRHQHHCMLIKLNSKNGIVMIVTNIILINLELQKSKPIDWLKILTF